MKVKRLSAILNYKISLSNLVIGLAFLAMTGLLAFGLWQFVVEFRDGWILGDWLVNYEDGGFKRRGLSGSFFLLLNSMTHVNPAVLVLYAQVILYGLFFALLYLLIRKRQVRWSLLILLFNPITLLFCFGDCRALGRKEIIIMIVFALFILTRKSHSKLRTMVFAVLISMATLLHELACFFVPYFLIIEYVSGDLNRTRARHFVVLFLAAFIPVLAIALWGKHINNGLTEAILASRGVAGRQIMGGVFGWGEGSSALHALINDSTKAVRYMAYIPYFILGVVPFVYYLRYINLTPKRFFSLLLFAFSFSLPLFVLGHDWGRWLNIHFTMILIMFIYLTPMRDPASARQVALKTITGAVLIVLYLMIWSVPHCAGGWRQGLIRKWQPLANYFVRLIY